MVEQEAIGDGAALTAVVGSILIGIYVAAAAPFTTSKSALAGFLSFFGTLALLEYLTFGEFRSAEVEEDPSHI